MAKKQNEEPVELLDLRGLSLDDKVRALHKQYKTANDVWKNYPHMDERLKETFSTLEKILSDYMKLASIEGPS